MAFFDKNSLRTILTTETDADSPGSEELLSQLRENFEALLIILLGEGTSSTVDSVSGDTLTDTAPGFTVDEHNGRTLVITSGTAIGNMYTIDDTTTTTLVCTGDNLETDGVATDDTYMIFYKLKGTVGGHSHDDIDSATVTLADNQVTEAKLGSIYRTLLSTDYGEVYTGQPSVAAGGPTVVATYPVYVPEGVTTVDVRIKGYSNIHNDTVTSTATLGGQSSGTATHNDDFVYDTATAITVSGSGWQTLTVSMTEGSSSTAYFLGIILVGY